MCFAGWLSCSMSIAFSSTDCVMSNTKKLAQSKAHCHLAFGIGIAHRMAALLQTPNWLDSHRIGHQGPNKPEANQQSQCPGPILCVAELAGLSGGTCEPRAPSSGSSMRGGSCRGGSCRPSGTQLTTGSARLRPNRKLQACQHRMRSIHPS